VNNAPYRLLLALRDFLCAVALCGWIDCVVSGHDFRASHFYAVAIFLGTFAAGPWKLSDMIFGENYGL
jgi:hypothetical protein